MVKIILCLCLFCLLISSFPVRFRVWNLFQSADGRPSHVPAYSSLGNSREAFERLNEDSVLGACDYEPLLVDSEASIVKNSVGINSGVETSPYGFSELSCHNDEPLFGGSSNFSVLEDYEPVYEKRERRYDNVNGSKAPEVSPWEITESPLVWTSSKTIYVNGSNVGDPLENGSLEHPFDRIQEGVNSASSGDTVYVFAGTYKEHLKITKTLRLTGDNRESVAVDGEGTGNCIYVGMATVDISVSKITLRNASCGVYLTGSHLSRFWADIKEVTIKSINGSGVFVNYYNVWINDTLIEDCANYGLCTGFLEGYTLYLAHSVLRENGGGVNWQFDPSSDYFSYLYVKDNTIIANNGNGLILTAPGYPHDWLSSATIGNNLIINNIGDGIYCGQIPSLIISNNTVVNASQHGIHACSWSPPTGATLEDNRIESSLYGIYLDSIWGATLRNNRIGSSLYGIYCYETSGTLRNNTAIRSTECGIYINSSANVLLFFNRVETSGTGIYLDSASSATLVGNVMLGNTYNFGVLGSELFHFTHNITTSNTVNGKPIYYLVGIQDTIIDFPDAGFVGIVNSVNITVQNLAMANNVEGILFAYVKSSSIRNVSVQGNEFGILFARVHSSGIRNVNVQSNGAGIALLSSTFNYVIGNNISDGEIGILALTSYLNFIYQNNLINNNQSVYVDSDVYVNSWDNGYPNGGNYWSDNNCVGDPSDGSQPYFIYGNVSWNVDRYPFQHPINLETSKSNLRIRVTDSSGNPIAGTLVTASYYQLVSSLDLQSITDTGGYVSFNDVISGTYTLYISANGYYPTINTGVVTAGQNTSEAVALSVNPQPYQNWALIVGVSRYKYASDLSVSDYGALALYNRLYPLWGKNHIKLLLNENATKQNIYDAIINWLASKENQDDPVLVFFAGHGGSDDSTYPSHEYICPYDFYGTQSSSITDSLLNDWLNILDSQKITAILDSCHSGGFMPEVSKSGRIILAACAADENATQTNILQRGVFTHCLLESFVTNGVDANMDGQISWQEIFSYAEPKATELNPEQHPQKYYGYPEEPVIVIPEFSQTLPLLFAILLATAFTLLIKRLQREH